MVSLKKKKPENDLKKNRETGLDLKKKVDVDADSGGIGISFDVTELENGDKISIGYEVEAPIQVGIDYNVSSNELGLSGGFEAPGDLVGLSGGVTIDLNSGEISGGELGVALGGVEVSIGESKCERTISISIAGVTTTYTQKKDNPDCGDDKEPEPPKGEDEEPPPDPPFTPLNPVGNFGDNDFGIAFMEWERYYREPSQVLKTKVKAEGSPNEMYGNSNANFPFGSWPFAINKSYTPAFSINFSGEKTEHTRNDGKWSAYSRTYTRKVVPFTEGWNGIGLGVFGSPFAEGFAPMTYTNVCFTSWGEIKSYLSNKQKETIREYNYGFIQCVSLTFYTDKEKITLQTQKPPKPPITPPEKKDMSCCDLEPVLSLLRKMSKVLAVDEMDGEGVKIPKRLFVPNGKGYEECKTYPKLMATQIRIADHLGIHPYKAQIDDSNAAQAGNQKLEVQVVNATAAAKMISELLLENKGDAATRLNLLVRNTVATGQILNAVAIAAKRIREVMRFLSIPVKEQIDYINMPFDFSFGNRDKKKGFQAGAKPNEALDINTEEATEKMLPKFMVNSKQPYVVEIFDEKQGTLLDILLKQSK